MAFSFSSRRFTKAPINLIVFLYFLSRCFSSVFFSSSSVQSFTDVRFWRRNVKRWISIDIYFLVYIIIQLRNNKKIFFYRNRWRNNDRGRRMLCEFYWPSWSFIISNGFSRNTLTMKFMGQGVWRLVERPRIVRRDSRWKNEGEIHLNKISSFFLPFFTFFYFFPGK